MFISKKVYKELVDSKEHWKNLAHRTLEQNEALLKDNGELIKICKELNEENKALLARLNEK